MTAGDRVHVRQLTAGTSYVSAHEPLLLFGLGDHEGPVDVEVDWPVVGEGSPSTQRIQAVAVDRRLTVTESTGDP